MRPGLSAVFGLFLLASASPVPGRRDEGEVRGGRRLFRRAWRAGAAGHGRRKGRLRALRPRVGGGAAAPPRQRHQELQRRPGRGGHPGPDHRETRDARVSDTIRPWQEDPLKRDITVRHLLSRAVLRLDGPTRR